MRAHYCFLLALALPLATSWTPGTPRRAPPVAMHASRPGQRSNSQRSRREQLLRDLETPSERREPDGEAIDDPAAGLALAACRAGDARKATSVSALRVAHLTSATSFFVTMVGRSKAQIQAIVKNVEDEVEADFSVRAHRQGKAQSGWVCLDYDTVVVNVFSERERDFYGVEKFWGAAQPLDLSGILLPNLPSEADVVEGDDGDDWLLGDEDDWELDDDDWGLDAGLAGANAAGAGSGTGSGGPAAGGGAAAAAAAAALPTGASPKAWAWDDAEEEDVEDEDEEEETVAVVDFGAASEVVAAAPWAEAELAEVVEEAAEEEDVEWAEGEGGEGDADWALGDDALRALVEKAERGDEEAPASPPGAPEGEGEGGGAGGGSWRSRMEEDGFAFDDEFDAVELPSALADELDVELGRASEGGEEDGE